MPIRPPRPSRPLGPLGQQDYLIARQNFSPSDFSQQPAECLITANLTAGAGGRSGSSCVSYYLQDLCSQALKHCLQVICAPICCWSSTTAPLHQDATSSVAVTQLEKTMLLSPKAERNWESLCSVLEDVLEDQSHRQLFALELGSGTGQHVIRFAQKIPFVTWQPSDIKEEYRDSIKAYIDATQAKTVLQPIFLDASEPWEKWANLSCSSCDVIIAINVLQYSSFKTAQGVFSGAGQLLKQNGVLVTHGVFAVNGIITPSCNEHLDEELRKLNPEWGLPDIDVLRQQAYGNGLRLERMVEMEDYYKCLIFRKL